jgi:hypothetical protein
MDAGAEKSAFLDVFGIEAAGVFGAQGDFLQIV